MGAPLATKTVFPAVFQWLTADPALVALVAPSPTGGPGIYDDVPQDAAFPHVVVGEPTEVKDHTLGGTAAAAGARVVVQTRVQSRYRGNKEATAILDAVRQRLDEAPLVVEGYRMAEVRAHEATHYYQDANGGVVTRYAVGFFEVSVHDAS